MGRKTNFAKTMLYRYLSHYYFLSHSIIISLSFHMKIHSGLYILGLYYHILESLDSKSLKTLQKTFFSFFKSEANLSVPDLTDALVGANS